MGGNEALDDQRLIAGEVSFDLSTEENIKHCLFARIPCMDGCAHDDVARSFQASS